MELVNNMGAWPQFWVLLAATFIRYWVITGTLHWFAWRKLPVNATSSHIYKIPPDAATRKREIFWSMLAIPIFASPALMMPWAQSVGLFHVVMAPMAEYGFGKAAVYFIAMLLLHDAYFYWLHRFMHHPKVFRHIHRVHHLSIQPSAFAAFSFHPYESILEVLYFPIAVALLPGVHFYTIVAFFTFDFFINSLSHSGIEWLPERFLKTRWGDMINTATIHHRHHKNSKGNYGFYFTFWDKLCGTLR